MTTKYPRIVHAIQLSSLDDTIITSSVQFHAIPDIFDRLIVTEAHLLGVPVVTRDPVITLSGYVTAVW